MQAVPLSGVIAAAQLHQKNPNGVLGGMAANSPVFTEVGPVPRYLS